VEKERYKKERLIRKRKIGAKKERLMMRMKFMYEKKRSVQRYIGVYK
jgi:hypothetical protein